MIIEASCDLNLLKYYRGLYGVVGPIPPNTVREAAHILDKSVVLCAHCLGSIHNKNNDLVKQM